MRVSAAVALSIAAPTLAFAQLAPAARPAPPLPSNTTEGSFQTSDGVRIRYLLTGSTGSWVVLIHGYSDSAQRMWFNTGIAPELAKHHRVVALDNRNHGQSDKPQPGGSGRAQDVIELMDHLHIQKAHIH
jgi:pimeloyl-ACP methyl ester carboxylesterase